MGCCQCSRKTDSDNCCSECESSRNTGNNNYFSEYESEKKENEKLKKKYMIQKIFQKNQIKNLKIQKLKKNWKKYTKK